MIQPRQRAFVKKLNEVLAQWEDLTSCTNEYWKENFARYASKRLNHYKLQDFLDFCAMADFFERTREDP